MTIGVWWLQQYAGGLFLPLRDGTAGETSYGGGRYVLDTAKGADLGGTASTLVIDLNFLYHPSCRYNSQWQCPLAPAANIIAAPVHAGERLGHSHLPGSAKSHHRDAWLSTTGHSTRSGSPWSGTLIERIQARSHFRATA